MRYFLINFNLKYAQGVKQNIGVAPLLTLFEGPSKDSMDESTIWIPQYNSRLAKFPFLDPSAQLPLDQDLMTYHASYFNLYFALFDRLDPLEKLGSKKRTLMIWDMIQYWESIVNHLKPERVFFRNIPHFTSEFILYQVLERTQTPRILGNYIEHLQRYQIFNSFYNRKSQKLILAKKDDSPEQTVDNLFLKLQSLNYQGVSYVDDRVTKMKFKKGVNKLYQRIWLLLFMLKGFYKRRMYSIVLNTSLKPPLKLQVGWHFFKNSFKIRRLEKYYKKVQSVENIPDQPYVFFPLQYQPECTSLPDAEMYYDQIKAIQLISKYIPDDWQILVKEHFATFWFPYKHLYRGNYARSKDFYERLRQIPKVRIVSLEVKTPELLQQSKFIATLTGSITLEGAVNQKHVLIFGNVWYESISGVHPIKIKEDMQNFMHSKLYDQEIDQIKLKNELKSQYKNSVQLLTFNHYDDSKIEEEIDIYLKAANQL